MFSKSDYDLSKDLPKIQNIISVSLEIIKNESVFLQVDCKKFRIFGDLHGNFDDLKLFFYKYGSPQCLKKYFNKFWCANEYNFDYSYIFLGDFCDKGESSVEIIISLLCLKIL